MPSVSTHNHRTLPLAVGETIIVLAFAYLICYLQTHHSVPIASSTGILFSAIFSADPLPTVHNRGVLDDIYLLVYLGEFPA